METVLLSYTISVAIRNEGLKGLYNNIQPIYPDYLNVICVSKTKDNLNIFFYKECQFFRSIFMYNYIIGCA